MAHTQIKNFSMMKPAMEKRLKISIIDDDCRRLTALLLWLEQFREFQVTGMLAGPQLASRNEHLSQSEILLLSDRALANYIRIFEKTLTGAQRPAVLLLKTMAEQILADSVFPECDGSLDVDSSLKDLYDQISKVAAKRKLIFTPGWLPASKAS